jgi:hypothetical protein
LLFERASSRDPGSIEVLVIEQSPSDRVGIVLEARLVETSQRLEDGADDVSIRAGENWNGFIGARATADSDIERHDGLLDMKKPPTIGGSYPRREFFEKAFT